MSSSFSSIGATRRFATDSRPKQAARAEIILPAVALFEMRYGHARSARRAESDRRLELFLARGVSVAAFDAEAPAKSALISRREERRSAPTTSSSPPRRAVAARRSSPQTRASSSACRDCWWRIGRREEGVQQQQQLGQRMDDPPGLAAVGEPRKVLQQKSHAGARNRFVGKKITGLVHRPHANQGGHGITPARQDQIVVNLTSQPWRQVRNRWTRGSTISIIS
jgi:predicted nucleic acid-binding protein